MIWVYIHIVMFSKTNKCNTLRSCGRSGIGARIPTHRCESQDLGSISPREPHYLPSVPSCLVSETMIICLKLQLVMLFSVASTLYLTPVSSSWEDFRYSNHRCCICSAVNSLLFHPGASLNEPESRNSDWDLVCSSSEGQEAWDDAECAQLCRITGSIARQREKEGEENENNVRQSSKNILQGYN